MIIELFLVSLQMSFKTWQGRAESLNSCSVWIEEKKLISITVLSKIYYYFIQRLSEDVKKWLIRQSGKHEKIFLIFEVCKHFFFNIDSNTKSWSLIWSYSKMQMNNYKSSCFNFDKISLITGTFWKWRTAGFTLATATTLTKCENCSVFCSFFCDTGRKKTLFSKVIHHVKSWPYCEKVHIFKNLKSLDYICSTYIVISWSKILE